MLKEISSLKDGLETERKSRQALEKEVNIILIDKLRSSALLYSALLGAGSVHLYTHHHQH